MITVDAIGLNKAQSQVAYLREAIAAYAGCYYRGSTRAEGSTNAEVMQWLKEGNRRSERPIRRDLKTLSQENADVIAEAWQREVERRIDNQADAAFSGSAPVAAKQAARAQSAAGFREASKVILRMLAERITRNLTADDNGRLTPAEKVGPSYSKKRQTRYGVSTEEIYKATGQLLADMDASNVGQVVLVPGSALK